MEQNKRFSVLIQHGSNNRIFEDNHFEAWHIYGEKLSFRSLVSGNAVIIDNLFFEQLPDSLKPLPCTQTVIVSNNRQYRPNIPHYEKLDSLEIALRYAAINPQKKRYVIGSPSLYFQALQPPFKEWIEEVYVLQLDNYSNGRIAFWLSEHEWQKETVSVIPKDRHQLCAMEFIRYTRKAA